LTAANDTQVDISYCWNNVRTRFTRSTTRRLVIYEDKSPIRRGHSDERNCSPEYVMATTRSTLGVAKGMGADFLGAMGRSASRGMWE